MRPRGLGVLTGLLGTLVLTTGELPAPAQPKPNQLDPNGAGYDDPFGGIRREK